MFFLDMILVKGGIYQSNVFQVLQGGIGICLMLASSLLLLLDLKSKRQKNGGKNKVEYYALIWIAYFLPIVPPEIGLFFEPFVSGLIYLIFIATRKRHMAREEALGGK